MLGNLSARPGDRPVVDSIRPTDRRRAGTTPVRTGDSVPDRRDGLGLDDRPATTTKLDGEVLGGDVA
jgi:hypothetical protein